MKYIRTNPAGEGVFNLLADIQDALGTEESGQALVEVARNAHKAEQELAAQLKLEQKDQE
jgi:hypothetical protein